MNFRILVAAAAICAAAVQAQPVPGLFIVEMEDAGKTDRRLAATQKDAVRAAVDQVVDSYEIALNGLAVRAGEGQRAALAAMPGVRRVYRVWEHHLHMDRVPGLHGIPEAWARVGRDRAGAGVKIAIVDSGIEWEHPAFQDPSLAMPDGYPKTGIEADRDGVTSKIIASRNYEDRVAATLNPGPRDIIGHGTAVAMAAAGSLHSSPIGTISGVAPKAFLGAYKVFAGVRGATRDDVVIRAIEDAVNDGMDIVNLSLGFSPERPSDDDPLLRAIETVTSRGVIVVKAAGNEGPDTSSISSSSTGSVIVVGSTVNDRSLLAAVTAGGSRFVATAGAGPLPAEPLRGSLIDVARFDPTGLACGPLPALSLRAQVALIARGVCTFEEKLNNAQAAGAAGAVVFSDGRPIDAWTPGNARLPALLIRAEDGASIKGQIAGGRTTDVLLQFELAAFELNPNQISSFSSRGPTNTATISPDLVATGHFVYVAAQRSDARGEVYDPRGYRVESGTSISSPVVAGAAAVLKAERQGLTPGQYKSLLVNTATPVVTPFGVAGVQAAGAGRLNLDRALKATVAASPVSLSFGAAGSSIDVSRTLTLTNVGTAAETYAIRAESLDGGATPTALTASVSLAPGESRPVTIRWAHGTLPPGEYQGYVIVAGSSGLEARVPYWYASTSPAPASISVVTNGSSGTPRPGGTFVFYVRVNDAAGWSLIQDTPRVTITSGDGAVNSVTLDRDFPGFFRVSVTLGFTAGSNGIRLQAGDVARNLNIGT